MTDTRPTTVPAILDPDSLISEAHAASGLAEAVDPGYLEAMRRWCAAIAEEGRVTPMGAQILRASIVRVLVNHQRMARDLREHPEILDEDVSNPIIVTGFTRTGTSKLQRLLSLHPDVQRLETWRLMNPAPFPPEDGVAEPRVRAAEQDTAMMAEMFPEWMAGHSSEAREVDEEIFVMEMTFEVVTFWRVSVPSFERWCEARPRETPYRLLKTVLQYLQWQDSTRRGRPFVMKSPWHLANLDLVQEMFPNATVACCHRDPLVAMASGSRLMEVLRRMTSDTVDLRQAGADEVRFWARAGRTHLEQRAALGSRLRIVDVLYSEILNDAEGSVRRVLEAHGMSLTEEALGAMREWELRNPQHRYGRWEYSLERYGLDGEDIDREFAAYSEAFGIDKEWQR